MIDNEGYEIDRDYPKRGRVVSNLIGIIECDNEGNK